MSERPVLLTTFQATVSGATPSAESATSSTAGGGAGLTATVLDAVAEAPPTTLAVAVRSVTLGFTGTTAAHWLPMNHGRNPVNADACLHRSVHSAAHE